MSKTEKELRELKEKLEELNQELKGLSEEELELVSGGIVDLSLYEDKDPRRGHLGV